jgi:hypothetical protein
MAVITTIQTTPAIVVQSVLFDRSLKPKSWNP